MIRMIYVTTLALPALGLAVQASGAGVCNVRYDTKNKARYVHGPVNVECGAAQGEANGPPFGNWGVETESTQRRDGHQFQGWCHDAHNLCDNEGDCADYCGDDWYEWNSCTTLVPRFTAPNPDFYNHASNREQKSARSGANVHGRGAVNLVVSCPVDTDGDFYADEGGCKEILDSGFSVSGHRMELWELDHWRPWDDFVGTLRFPTLRAPTGGLDCNMYECGGGSVGTYRSRGSGSTTLVSAKAAIQITSAVFEDLYGSCCDPLSDPSCE